jgi:hypothetical protein
VSETHVKTGALQPLLDAVSDCDLVLDYKNSHEYLVPVQTSRFDPF